MYFIIWIYHYFIYQLPCSRIFSLFQVFSIAENVVVPVGDFVFSWCCPPQTFEHAGSQRPSCGRFMTEPRHVYYLGTVFSCYFLDSHFHLHWVAGTRVLTAGLRHHSLCFSTHCLGWELGSCRGLVPECDFQSLPLVCVPLPSSPLWSEPRP